MNTFFSIRQRAASEQTTPDFSTESKNNILRHLAVIPLGGANINRDICSLQIEDDEAEQLKLTYGSAVVEENEKTDATITLRDGRTIRQDEFAGLVEARVEEIILNIDNQIALSQYNKSQLIGGLIITGGASHMKGIDKAFTRDTHFEKIRFVRNIRWQLRATDYPEFNRDGDCNAAIALIDKGDINCCGGTLGQPTLFPAEQEETKKEEPTGPTPEELAEQERLRKEQEAAAEAARLAAEQEEERRRGAVHGLQRHLPR